MLGFAILTTAATTSAVQLANFQPIRIENAQCRAAYTTNIEGCQSSDFDPKATAKCSEACVAGLKKIGEVVKRVCRDVDVGETSIIGVFQNGIGVAALCPVIATPSPPASSARPQTSAQPPSSRPASSAATPSSALETVTSSTISASSEATQSSSTSSGILVDPNPTSISVGSPTNLAPSLASSTAAAAPSRAPNNAQLSNADSGGGSPFDVVASTGASSQLRAFDLTMATLLGTALLFGAFA